MEPFESIARPKLLHQSAQGAIRDYILRNNLRGGDPLHGEIELARQLGISRNSVREAIRALQSIGILEVRRGRGVFVQAFSFEPLLENLFYGLLTDLREVEELLDIRCILETGTVERAVAAITDESLAELEGVVARMGERAARGEAFPDEDRQFHRLVFRGMGNETFLRLLDVFWLAFQSASQVLDDDPHPERTWRDHVAILEAIAARDSGRAREALERHYAGITDRLASARSGAQDR